MQPIYTIRQLTKEFAVTARTLRFYEDKGLVSPARRGQTRIYSARDRSRLILVLRGRRVGLSLAEIGEILDLYYMRDGGRAQLLLAREKFQERIAVLERQKIEIEKALAELRNGIDTMHRALVERHAAE
jgi:DNA-binding transcriptional MerR regulator